MFSGLLTSEAATATASAVRGSSPSLPPCLRAQSAQSNPYSAADPLATQPLLSPAPAALQCRPPHSDRPVCCLPPPPPLRKGAPRRARRWRLFCARGEFHYCTQYRSSRLCRVSSSLIKSCACCAHQQFPTDTRGSAHSSCRHGRWRALRTARAGWNATHLDMPPNGDERAGEGGRRCG